MKRLGFRAAYLSSDKNAETGTKLLLHWKSYTKEFINLYLLITKKLPQVPGQKQGRIDCQKGIGIASCALLSSGIHPARYAQPPGYPQLLAGLFISQFTSFLRCRL
jgi:hypothetical protein